MINEDLKIEKLHFFKLIDKHVKRWRGDPTIVDSYINKFHGFGKVLVVNVGPKRRITLKKGFKININQYVDKNNLRVIQWKDKNGRFSRLRWVMPSKYINGSKKLKVESNNNSLTVTSSRTGLLYALKKNEFKRGIYITNTSFIEFVDPYGILHNIQIRKKKNSKDPVDKQVKVIGIHIKTENVSKFSKYNVKLKNKYNSKKNGLEILSEAVSYL
jgi:hypothetical protein